MIRLITLLALFLLVARVAQAQTVTSVYTTLAAKKCKTIQVDKESGSSTQRCVGVAGYHLLVEDSDNRISITVVAPGGKKHALNYWDVITHAFSNIGDKAEWRMKTVGRKRRPIALIVRVNANEDSDTNKRTSYLAVAKITPQSICVTDKIQPGAKANEEARAAADAAAGKACLKE
jgi:hypothetical protein